MRRWWQAININDNYSDRNERLCELRQTRCMSPTHASCCKQIENRRCRKCTPNSFFFLFFFDENWFTTACFSMSYIIEFMVLDLLGLCWLLVPLFLRFTKSMDRVFAWTDSIVLIEQRRRIAVAFISASRSLNSRNSGESMPPNIKTKF